MDTETWIVIIVLALIVLAIILYFAYDHGSKIIKDWQYWERKNKRVHDNLYQLMQVSDEMLRKHACPYWISDGTLLGTVRFGKILPWDDDADLSVLEDQHFKDELPKMMQEFEQGGKYKLSMHFLANQYRVTDCKTGVFIDWFVMDPTPKTDGNGREYYRNSSWIIRTFGGEVWWYKDEVFPLREYECGGHSYLGPSQPWPYLARNYGPNFYKHGKATHTHVIDDPWDYFSIVVAGRFEIIELPQECIDRALAYR